MSSAHPLDFSASFTNDRHMHIVVCDEPTGHLLDFELVPLPLTMQVMQRALLALRARHLQRLEAELRDVEYLPTDNELEAHRVPEDAAVVEYRPHDPAAEREVRDRVRHAQMAARLAPLSDLYCVSPYRPAGGR